MRAKYLTKTHLRNIDDYDIRMYVRSGEDVVVVKRIVSTKNKFVVSTGEVLVDNGYYIVEILPQNTNYTVRIFLNDKKEVLEYYFDVVKSCGLDENTKVPYYDDLFLDVIILGGKVKLLDQQELDDAFAKGEITQDEYVLAVETAQNLLDEINSKKNKYLKFDYNKYLDFESSNVYEK